jgi:hypothetical protein
MKFNVRRDKKKKKGKENKFIGAQSLHRRIDHCEENDVTLQTLLFASVWSKGGVAHANLFYFYFNYIYNF